MHYFVSSFSSLMFLALSLSAIAQQIPEEFLACAAIDTDVARLACYDREMTRKLLAQGQAAALDAPAEETADQADSTEADITPASVAAATASPSRAAASESQATAEVYDIERSPNSPAGIAAAAPHPAPAPSPAPAAATMSSKAVAENAASAAEAKPAAATTPAATAVSTSENAVEEFGMTERLARERAAASRSAVPEEPKGPEQISAVVTDIERQPHGEHIVALDNGQIWQEEEASRYFPVEVGDTVVIKKRLLRGYRLIAKSGKGFAVKRLR